MVRSQHKKVKPHKAHAVHHASHPSHAVHHASHASHGVHHASHASHSVHHASHASHSVHRVSKPAVHESHSQDSVLYFLEDYNKYRSSKIQLLSSKSSVLMSRERIKKLKELKEKDVILQSKISREAISLRRRIKTFYESLPKPKENLLNDRVVKAVPVSVGEPRKEEIKISEVTHDEIKGELAEINKKLAELGATAD